MSPLNLNILVYLGITCWREWWWWCDLLWSCTCGFRNIQHQMMMMMEEVAHPWMCLCQNSSEAHTTKTLHIYFAHLSFFTRCCLAAHRATTKAKKFMAQNENFQCWGPYYAKIKPIAWTKEEEEEWVMAKIQQERLHITQLAGSQLHLSKHKLMMGPARPLSSSYSSSSDRWPQLCSNLVID